MSEFDKEYTTNTDESIGELPKPSSRRGNIFKFAILTLLIVSTTAATLFWLSRDEETQENVKNIVQNEIESAVENTPLEKPLQTVVEYIKPSPPPPPSVTNPATAPGTLAGQNIRTSMSAPPPHPTNTHSTRNENTHTTKNTAQSDADVTASTSTDTTDPDTTTPLTADTVTANTTATDAKPEIITPIIPKVEEDSVVPLPFVEDVAHWMVRHYVPNKGVNLSISAINLRYGQQMHALMPKDNENQGDIYTARTQLLRYAFNPPMLNALYSLYADRFVDSLANAAATPQKGKALTPEQTSDMYKAYSLVMASLGGVLNGIGNMTDFQQRMQEIDALSQEALSIHSQLTDAVFNLDTARENGDATAQRAAQLRVDGLNATYQRVLNDRQDTRTKLINDLYTQEEITRAVDADTVFFVAEWLERREGTTQESSLAAAKLLQNLADRLRKAADTIQ